MNLKSFLTIVVCALMAAGSMAMFRVALHGKLSWDGDLFHFLRNLIGFLVVPQFLVAVSLFVMSNVIWMYVIATQKLSLAYPLQIGMAICFTGFIGHFAFAETIKPTGYIGYVLVIMGVFFVSR